MSGAGHGIRKLGGEWQLLLISLLIALIIWFLYAISLDYSAFYRFEIVAKTNIEGHIPNATSEEVLIARVKGPGYGILRNKLSRKAERLELNLDASDFLQNGGDRDVFLLPKEALSDALLMEKGGLYTLEYIETDFLTFRFPSQSYRRLPLVAQYDFTYADQYMPVDKIRLEPDSVTVYGLTEDLKRLTSVNTKMMSMYDIDRSVHGIVQVAPISGFRISEEHVKYTVNVTRYVEKKATVTLDVINLPRDRHLVVLPSQITVYYRVPFKSGKAVDVADPSFAVDYDDYITSRSGIVIPVLSGYDGEILSYRIEPQLVECIQTN